MNSLFIDFYHIEEYLPASSGISIVEIFSIIIALLAIFISVRSIVITKQKEIEYDKFKRISLELLNEQFDIVRKNIDLYKRHNKKLAILSDSLTDLTLFLTSMRAFYPRMDIDKLQDEINNFSDSIFENTDNIENNFNNLKLTLFAKIYDYALKEIPFFQFLKK